MEQAKDSKALVAVKQQLRQPEFMRALEDVIPVTAAKYLTPERIVRIVVQASQRGHMLLECTPISLIRAVVCLAELGLEPGGQLQHGYLVPFKNNKNGGVYEVQPIVGYRGYLELFRRSGQRKALAVSEICENDEFDYQLGDDPRIFHKPTLSGRGDVIGAYCIAIFSNDACHREIMGIEDIEKIRLRSPSQSPKKDPSGPWRTDYAMMCRKTVIHRAARYWPLSSDEISRGTGLDNMVDSGEWAERLAQSAIPRNKTWADAPHLPTAEILDGLQAPPELPAADTGDLNADYGLEPEPEPVAQKTAAQRALDLAKAPVPRS